MEAQLRPPAASPALAPAAASGAVPDGRSVPQGMEAERATSLLNANAIVVLALLVCGFVAAVALHVALRCALRATRRACHYGGGADDDDDVAPHLHQEHYRRDARRHGGGGGRKQRVAALVQTLPSVAYTAGLELAGSSRSECAICLAEFAREDPVRVLPRCTHGFHARCIDRWLAPRPTCPVCRQPPFAEPAALLRPGTGRARPGQPAAVQLVRVVIVSDGASRRVEP